MNANQRVRLESADSILTWMRQNPSTDPVIQARGKTLAELAANADARLMEQRDGTLAVRAAVAGKNEMRRAIHHRLAVVAGYANAAAVMNPGVDIRLERPNSNGSQKGFLAAARQMLQAATERRDQLSAQGMTEGYLEGIEALLAQYEQLLGDTFNGRTVHVGASAELDATLRAIAQVIEHLDVLMRDRLREDADLLAEWKSVRNVHWPHTRREEGARTDAARGSTAA
ncbi:MAG TPA: hypothetical protein PKA50_00635 [Gemmatimonadales bacterium]|nr:hypothetical protein [Gemmatimonadales bacterium]